MIDFKLFGGFGNWQTDGRMDGQTDELTDIGGCRVAFATENSDILLQFLDPPTPWNSDKNSSKFGTFWTLI